jgi:hypothetical protein
MVGQLHDEVRPAFVFVESVNVDDIGVVERSACPGFAIEAVHYLFVIRDLLLHELHGNLTSEVYIEGAVNDSHAAGGDNFSELELTKLKGNYDRMAAFAARNRLEAWQITRKPVTRLARAANGSPQRGANRVRGLRHSNNIAITAIPTSFLIENAPIFSFPQQKLTKRTITSIYDANVAYDDCLSSKTKPARGADGMQIPLELRHRAPRQREGSLLSDFTDFPETHDCRSSRGFFV